ncbi:Protein SMG8 [Bienertia sinuspersici]
MDSNKPNPTSMRVLIRPPSTSHQPSASASSTTTTTISSSSKSPSSPSPPPPPPPRPPPSVTPSQPPQLSSGVVVVGFIGRRHIDVSQLINRILDSNVFGSSHRDTPFDIDDVNEEVKLWLNNRRISYYHDEQKGLLFLQMSSLHCPAMFSNSGFDSVVEDQDFGDLQGMLFMFTVCHVIIYVQEGSRFDTQVLKILRVLQSSKHALMPFLRSQSVLPSVTRPSSYSSCPPTPATSSKNPSPRRSSGVSNRNSSISTMSSLGSYTALYPGQCTPVTLFAFVDDFSEMGSASATAEESNESSSSQSGMSSLAKSNFPVKGSSSVVVLSRPSNKCEGGVRKKLQSSIEAQIRFLIKKCRTLSGSDSSAHVGPRSGALSGLAPLLTLDASRAVVLIESSGIVRGESLDFATGLVEDVLSGTATPDALLLESHSQSGNKDDIMTLKEFIYRQADILRGKGGSVTNSSSGSVAGVGMVAVAAAAAAAASTASGRATSVPELPNLEMWLCSSQLILKGILSAKPGSIDEPDLIRKKFRQRNGVPPLAEGVVPKGADPLGSAISLLEIGKGINRKFSALWCQRALPAAMEVYLKDLPPCYPTLKHEAQLEKALCAFYSMVKGPSVQEFRKKLEDECMSIWKSGRQLCDAISLTGKPCMHQRHDIEKDGLPSDVVEKEHISGFVFLHACACGRSRQLRADPFDFESANSKFNIFSDCDSLLPMLQLPKVGDSGPIQSSSWNVVRLGGAQYYNPSKGLLQAGFSYTQKFLLRWTVVLEKDKHSNVSFANALRQGSFRSKPGLKVESTAVNTNKKSAALVEPGEAQGEAQGVVEDHGKVANDSISDAKKISFGRGLPITTMKKAFSEVVAGSTSSSSAFPPLQPKVQLSSGLGKGAKKNAVRVASTEQHNISVSDVQRSEKSEEVSENSTGMNNIGCTDGNPFLHIGSTVVPLKADDNKKSETNNAIGEKTCFNPSVRHYVVYVGFEHECPRGHRFVLSPELMNQLGQPYSLPEESQVSFPVEHGIGKHRSPLKSGKSDGHSKSHRSPNGTATIEHKVSSLERSCEVVVDSNPAVNVTSLSKPLEQTSLDSTVLPNSITDLQQGHCSLNVENNGPAFALLNRHIPLYMDCPHCRASKNKKDGKSLKFAGSVSQLQRIFVVTPPFPVVLATNPVVQFEGSLQPESVSNHEQQLEFSLGCQVILPSESLSLSGSRLSMA